MGITLRNQAESTGRAAVSGCPPLLVFDVGNVLLRFDFNRAARNFERVEPGSGRKLLRGLWFSPLGRRLETGKISGRETYRRLKTAVRLKMSYAAFRRAYNNIFSPMRRNLALLERLAARNIPTALLSNTNAIHWRHMLGKYPALKKARFPLASHLLGFMKPDPRIFRALAARTGVPIRRMVYFDDRPENVRAARRLGLRAVLYDGRRPLSHHLREMGLFTANGKNPGLTEVKRSEGEGHKNI